LIFLLNFFPSLLSSFFSSSERKYAARREPCGGGAAEGEGRHGRQSSLQAFAQAGLFQRDAQLCW